MQGIMFLSIGAPAILCPLALARATISPGAYFTIRVNRHKKRIAAEFKAV